MSSAKSTWRRIRKEYFINIRKLYKKHRKIKKFGSRSWCIFVLYFYWLLSTKWIFSKRKWLCQTVLQSQWKISIKNHCQSKKVIVNQNQLIDLHTSVFVSHLPLSFSERSKIFIQIFWWSSTLTRKIDWKLIHFCYFFASC